MEGLRRHQDKIRFVLVHHEEAAAFMATAHAKATGKIGVCLATSGPGGIHLLNGLYDAKMDPHRLRAARRPAHYGAQTTSRWPRRAPTRGSTSPRPARRRQRPSACRRPACRQRRTCSGSRSSSTKAARSPSWRARDRHALPRRHELPVHQAPAVQRARRADRGRPGPRRCADRHRAADRRRRQAGAARPAAAAQAAVRHLVPGEVSEGDGGLAPQDGKPPSANSPRTTPSSPATAAPSPPGPRGTG